jgi:hypothetical protein
LAAYLLMVVIDPAPLLSHSSVTPDYRPHRWWAMLAFGYLPILGLILRRRNVSAASDPYQ